MEETKDEHQQNIPPDKEEEEISPDPEVDQGIHPGAEDDKADSAKKPSNDLVGPKCGT